MPRARLLLVLKLERDTTIDATDKGDDHFFEIADPQLLDNLPLTKEPRLKKPSLTEEQISKLSDDLQGDQSFHHIK